MSGGPVTDVWTQFVPMMRTISGRMRSRPVQAELCARSFRRRFAHLAPLLLELPWLCAAVLIRDAKVSKFGQTPVWSSDVLCLRPVSEVCRPGVCAPLMTMLLLLLFVVVAHSMSLGVLNFLCLFLDLEVFLPVLLFVVYSSRLSFLSLFLSLFQNLLASCGALFLAVVLLVACVVGGSWLVARVTVGSFVSCLVPLAPVARATPAFPDSLVETNCDAG